VLSVRSDYCFGIDQSQQSSPNIVWMCDAGHILQGDLETMNRSSHARPYVERHEREDSSFQRSKHAAAREGATAAET